MTLSFFRLPALSSGAAALVLALSCLAPAAGAATPAEMLAGYTAQAGGHASTGKAIKPLAPAFNPERFTDPAKTEKWFRRNCNDVMRRECSPAEKSDVLAWLTALKP